jgi:hypothetical protein
MAKASILFASIATTLVVAVPVALAHHSYADFDREQSFELAGIISAVHWGNPHILLTVDAGDHTVRVEWVTTAGADRTGVARERFQPGDHIVVVGSRHRDPEVPVMTLVKELRLPLHDWQWLSPSIGSRW